MQYYRDKLRAKIENNPQFKIEKPDYESGRKQGNIQSTPQQDPYQNLNRKNQILFKSTDRDILQELFDMERHSLSELGSLSDRFEEYMTQQES